MRQEREVVVVTNLSIERRSDGKMFAAHLEELGLTAYGRTAGRARQKVTRLFNQWVNLHREAGILAWRLDEIGASWQYIDEYDGETPVEHTGTSVARALPEEPSEIWVEEPLQYHAYYGKPAMAA